MECLDKKSSTWFSGIDAVDSSLSLGTRKVVLCGIFCTILMSMTKVKYRARCISCAVETMLPSTTNGKGAVAAVLGAVSTTRAMSRLAASNEAMG